jgi:hypothetical protein
LALIDWQVVIGRLPGYLGECEVQEKIRDDDKCGRIRSGDPEQVDENYRYDREGE